MQQAAATPRSWPEVRLGLAAWLAGLTASLFNLLNYHEYNHAGPELAILILCLFGIASIMTGLHWLARPRLTFLFTALFLAILIDLNMVMERNWFFVCVGLLAVMAYLREAMLLRFAIAIFSSVLAFQLFFFVSSANEENNIHYKEIEMMHGKAEENRLPPIIHLIMDSYSGIEGMRLAEANFGTLAGEQEDFYLARGFTIYPGAFSRHVKTINSLPYFLSYGRSAFASKTRDLQRTSPPLLEYFRDLDHRGYRISALTPSFVDFCPHQPVTWCRNFNRSKLGSMLGSRLSGTDRAKLIGFTMLGLTHVPLMMAELSTRLANDHFSARWRSPYNRLKLFPLTSFREMEDFTRELRTLKHGEMRLAHFLLPHDPYMFDARCNLLPEREWLDEHGPGALALRDRAYANQLRCLTRKLATLLDALDQTPAGREAIVLIQGDHGARTIDYLPLADGPEPSLRELILSHSALFAIRIPGQGSASIPGRHALDRLLADFARSGFTAAPRPPQEAGEVLLMDAYWIPRKRKRLPDLSEN